MVRVQAFDEDPGYNGLVKCSFKVNGSNVQETAEFKIDPDSGLITTKKSLDAEAVQNMNLFWLQTTSWVNHSHLKHFNN